MSLVCDSKRENIIKRAKMQYFTKLLLLMPFIIKMAHPRIYYDIEIDANRTRGRFKQFWKSTGFSPLEPKENAYKFLLDDDEKLNIALIGSLPNKGITQVRIHWLLNLITQHKPGSEYNFTYLDNLMDHLVKYNLKPGFEIMGHPIIINPNNASTYKSTIKWYNIVEQIAIRYIDKYGSKEVNKWRFETWNEPDLKSYNTLNFSLSEYLTYVNGCSEGLKNAFSRRNGSACGKLGGPAGLFRDGPHHPLCWGLLELCNGLGKPRCPVQFISFHRKGDGTAEGLLNVTLELLDLLHDKFPNLTKFPLANDEADLLKTWSKAEEWRADCRYAANVVKVIGHYYKSVRLDRKWKIEVLSNDNGFLNYHPYYFTQRTLFARFQMNRTHPPHRQFIKKPVYTVMGLLSFLKGGRFMKKNQINQDPFLTILATRNDRPRYTSVSILMSYANGTEVGDAKNAKHVSVTINNLPHHLVHGGKYLIYVLDNTNTNPYQLWKLMGAPAFPDQYVRQAMRDVEEPFRLRGPTAFSSTNITIPVVMQMPSVALIHLCTYGDNYPGPVHSVNIFNITRNEILLTWAYSTYETECIRTYEVEQASDCPDRAPGFRRVNLARDTIFLTYHHSVTDDGRCEKTRGRYRVRAVDYWDRPGTYSQIVYYP